MSEHPIDAYFRNNLEAQQLPVPTEIWNNIEAALPPAKRRFPYLWVAAAVAVLFGGVLWLRPQQALYSPQTFPQQNKVAAATPSALEKLLQNGPATQNLLAMPQFSVAAKGPSETPAAKVATIAVLDEQAFEASMEEIRVAMEALADTNAAKVPTFKVLVELARPETSKQLQTPTPNIPQTTDFNLNDYATNQFNNLIHGAPLESPLKGLKSITKNPTLEKITQFFKSQND